MIKWAAWLLAGVAAAALAFGGFHVLDQAVRGSPEPDLAAFASSAQVRASDQLASNWLRQQQARLTRRAPWLAPAGHSLADECSGSGGGGGMLSGGIGASVSCQRTETWFLAVSGGKRDIVARLERILRAADGWGRFTSVPVGAASPPVLPVISADWVGPAGPRPPGGKIDLELIWVDRRSQLPAAVLGAQQSQFNADQIRYLQVRRPDLDAIARTSFGAHRHVLVVSFVDSYYAVQSPTPPPSSSGRGLS